MRTLFGLSLLMLALPVAAATEDRPLVLIVVGAEGSEEYGRQFRQWASRWDAAATKGKAEPVTIGLETLAKKSDRELLRERLTGLSQEPRPVWIVLIGHGTFDGKTAKFNLRGPDITPADLKEWLGGGSRPVVVINSASSSGPFLTELSGKDRVIVTATKSGHEYNFARLGDYLSTAIADPGADLDKDEQTSLLEAFLSASAKVREFYAKESRLATEHALIDDNGDGLGTPADWFKGLRPIKAAKEGAALDGSLANRLVLAPSGREEQLSAQSRRRRDDLERELAKIRQRKGAMPEDEYLALLEPLLLELARLYEQAGEKSSASPSQSTAPRPTQARQLGK